MEATQMLDAAELSDENEDPNLDGDIEVRPCRVTGALFVKQCVHCLRRFNAAFSELGSLSVAARSGVAAAAELAHYAL